MRRPSRFQRSAADQTLAGAQLTIGQMATRFQKRHRLSSDDLASSYLRKRILPALQGGALASSVVPGVCEFTTDNEGASCSAWDFKGSWTARSLHACVALCAACGHCFHISYDKRSYDCSFFRFCDSTHVVGTGHTTHQVRHSDGTPVPSVAGLSTAALQLSWSPPHKPAPEPPGSFFMYTDPALDHGWLRHCPGFEELQAGVRAERLGEVQMRDVLSRSPWRVSDPSAAQLFYVPLWEYASYALGQCNGTSHTQRMARAADALRASPQFARSRGADHVWVSTASQLHEGEVAAWLDTSVGSNIGSYAGLYARVGKPLAQLLERTIVGRYKSHGPLRSRVGASVVEIPFPANQHASHQAAERGGHARPTLLYFAGSLDVCAVEGERSGAQWLSWWTASRTWRTCASNPRSAKAMGQYRPARRGRSAGRAARVAASVSATSRAPTSARRAVRPRPSAPHGRWRARASASSRRATNAYRPACTQQSRRAACRWWSVIGCAARSTGRRGTVRSGSRCRACSSSRIQPLYSKCCAPCRLPRRRGAGRCWMRLARMCSTPEPTRASGRTCSRRLRVWRAGSARGSLNRRMLAWSERRAGGAWRNTSRRIMCLRRRRQAAVHSRATAAPPR